VEISGSPEGTGEQVEHARLVAQRDVRVGRGRLVPHPLKHRLLSTRHRLLQLTPLQPAFDSQDSGYTSTSDPAAPSAKKAAKKSQKSQPAALASEPDVISDSGSTSTSDPAAPSAKKAAKKSQKSQPDALASEPDVEILGDPTRGGTGNPLLPTSSEEKSPPTSKIQGLQAPPTGSTVRKKAAKKVRSHSRPHSHQSRMWRSQIQGLQAPLTQRHRPPKRQRKKSEVTAGRPCLRARCGDLRRRYLRMYSTTPCCPPAQRRNPRPHPRFYKRTTFCLRLLGPTFPTCSWNTGSGLLRRPPILDLGGDFSSELVGSRGLCCTSSGSVS
jgi:hypothetical protein